ncbi:MAG: iron-sulfur cluster assembly scaffold protein [Chakrabartia sp.]
MTAALYNTDILRLAASIPHLGRLSQPHGSAERRSPICGSRIVVDIILDSTGRISHVGLEPRACALGQASASLMAAHVVGCTPQDVETASVALGAYLAGKQEDPGTWSGLSIFGPARPHSARHAAIRLAFEAAADAARQAQSGA